MNYAFFGDLKTFLSKTPNQLVDEFTNNFQKNFREYPDISLKNSWLSSIKFLQSVFNHTKLKDIFKDIFEGIFLVFEYELPLGNERVDLMVFGCDKDNKSKILLFEMKGWQNATLHGSLGVLVDSDIGITTHPEYQVENYLGKIKFSHSEADNFDIIPAVLMYNMQSQRAQKTFPKKVDVFFEDEIQKLVDFISSHIQKPIKKQEVDRFLNGKYVQSKKLFDAIRNHHKDIMKAAYFALAQSGYGLSEEQLKVVEDIIRDVESGRENTVYLIQGEPGSGKTLVAICLLLRSLSKKYKTLLGYVNNRLIESVRNIFRSIQRGLDDPIKFYAVGSSGRYTGIAERNFKDRNDYALIIYDEAQRMNRENIHYGMLRARITVFLYDEKQILLKSEEGLTENFINEAKRQGKQIEQRLLKGYYRVRGGKEYHDFVETLLECPTKVSKDMITPWQNDYEFKVCRDIKDLINKLKTIGKDQKNKVALIAAFTESRGSDDNPKSIENLRIGYPLFSGLDIYKNSNLQIYWLMDPRSDYVPFWVDCESNNLEKCASIYGCQGFEADYVGVIWGRDFVFRNDHWEVGNYCEDNIGKPSLKTLIKRGNHKDALRLLKNRYRIFLTRGIKGTYIFCEDQQTADFLASIFER